MFAKLFDTPHGQLLATRDYDDDESPEKPYTITARGQGNDVADPSMTFTWETAEERDAAFEAIDQEAADQCAAMLAGMLVGFSGKRG